MPYISNEKLQELRVFLEFAKKDLARREKKIAEIKRRHEEEEKRIRKEHY